MLLFCMLLTMVPTVAVAAGEGLRRIFHRGDLCVAGWWCRRRWPICPKRVEGDEAMANAKDGNVFVVVGTVENGELDDAGERYYDLRREREPCIKFAGYYGKRKCLAFVTGRSHS